MTTKVKPDEVADAIYSALISPNEMDRNFESANVVDGMFAIARALDRVASALAPRPKSEVE